MGSVCLDAKDVVVGCISGLNFDQIAPWVGSLESSGFQGRKVLIHVRVEPQTIRELTRFGFETFDASGLHMRGQPLSCAELEDDEISVNRFYYIWHYLSQCGTDAQANRFLVATDVTDVVFQRDPISWLRENLGTKKLVAGCESLHFEDEPWGARTMQECYGPDVWNSYRRRLIYNAGTIAGDFRTMIDLFLQIYLLAPGARIRYCDQQAFNLLLGSAIYQEITHFAASEEGWACQAGTTAEPGLLEQVRDRLTGPLPVFDGEFVRTAGGRLFTLVHQYNRVPEWNSALVRKYGDSIRTN